MINMQIGYKVKLIITFINLISKDAIGMAEIVAAIVSIPNIVQLVIGKSQFQ